jgi:hypothetical protein
MYSGVGEGVEEKSLNHTADQPSLQVGETRDAWATAG